MSIHIITDSAADLTEENKRRLYAVVPLSVSFGEEVFADGVTLSKDKFYERLEKSKELPRTSQPSPEAFEKVFRKLQEQGDSAVVITISSGLSGTYQSACLAAQKYPNVRVVDSQSVSIGTGVLAEYACSCAEKGMELDELARHLTEKREEIGLIAMVDTLKYLRKGGRISGAAAVAGEVLNIKPVITIKDGKVAILGKARGSRKANNFLIEQIRRNGVNYSMPILLGFTGQSDELLQNYVRDSSCLWQGHVDHLDSVKLCSVIGTHAGPGAVAVAYFCK
ncbi:MAG: DegV family protein [Lachnospiraceae bacterium]|jgi:DegV family protein with EDD domain|nr:DegV family protein [Lachnospiraceae bacterium]